MYLGFWESSSNLREAITSRKSHCLLRFLVRRCDWTLLLRKRRCNDSHRQFGALWSYDSRLVFACYWRIQPHNSSEYGFIARDISRPRNFSQWRYQLATKTMRFDIIRLLLFGYAKDRVYANKPSTLEHLKTNIRQVMAEVYICS